MFWYHYIPYSFPSFNSYPLLLLYFVQSIILFRTVLIDSVMSCHVMSCYVMFSSVLQDVVSRGSVVSHRLRAQVTRDSDWDLLLSLQQGREAPHCVSDQGAHRQLGRSVLSQKPRKIRRYSPAASRSCPGGWETNMSIPCLSRANCTMIPCYNRTTKVPIRR